MFLKKVNIYAVAAAALVVTSTSIASGGSSSAKSTDKMVDQSYEAGKALLSGRVDGIDAADFCLSVDGQATPVASALSSFKGGSSENLVNSMVSCANPETMISSLVDADSMQSVVHYLNKANDLGLN